MSIEVDMARGEDFLDDLMLEDDGIEESIARHEEIRADREVKYLVRATQDTDEDDPPSVIVKTGFPGIEDALDYIDELEDRDDSIYTVEHYYVDGTGIDD